MTGQLPLLPPYGESSMPLYSGSVSAPQLHGSLLAHPPSNLLPVLSLPTAMLAALLCRTALCLLEPFPCSRRKPGTTFL